MKKILLYTAAALVSMLAFSSCVDDEPYGPASITDITNTVAFSANDAVTVTANIAGLQGVESADLYYKAGSGSYSNVAMTANGKVYTGVIPAQAKGVTVSYYISALSKSGDVTQSAELNYTVGSVPVDYTGLRLNELNGNDKFIELYNAGDHDIFLGGVQMFKDGSFAEATWTAPDENLAKGAYMLLYSEDVAASKDGFPEKYVFHSGLSAKKAVRITITKPDGTTVISDFNLTTHPTGSNVPGSYGLNSDGVWYIQTTATPGAANVNGTDVLTGLTL